jgi:hypothetical protein
MGVVNLSDKLKKRAEALRLPGTYQLNDLSKRAEVLRLPGTYQLDDDILWLSWSSTEMGNKAFVIVQEVGYEWAIESYRNRAKSRLIDNLDLHGLKALLESEGFCAEQTTSAEQTTEEED